MTKQKSFKRRVRARMEKTSESYSAARLQLLAKSQQANGTVVEPTAEPAPGEATLLVEEAPSAAPPAPVDTGVKAINTSDEAIARNTGKEWKEWFTLLDAWGATERKHAEIARWISEQHGIPGWWAQNVTVAYEQARGLRVPGQEADGTFSVSGSKTVAVPVDRLFEAFDDRGLREQWLPGAKVRVTTSKAPKSFRARWGDDGRARLEIGFYPKGDGKSMVAMGIAKLPNPEAAKDAKAYWTERLKALKELLEA